MDSECPVCLESLSGTVVHMGCCKNMVHMQCYTIKCPMCRADLPVPIHAVQPQHVIVPVPVVYQPRERKVASILVGLLGLTSGIFLITYTYYS